MAGRLRNEIETLITSSINLMHIKLVLPTQSEYLIRGFMHTLLETLLDKVNFGEGERRMDLTIYTSCNRGKEIRAEVVQQLRQFNRGVSKVEQVCALDLRMEDLEKIVEFNYLELKYYRNGSTKSASPLNSFIFSKELLKKGLTPIFLPTEQELSQGINEYLVCCLSKEVYEVRGRRILKLAQQYD